MFYTYVQNNSRGSLHTRTGAISVYVIVEADSFEEADARARDIGLYFDGVESGEDCSCCGNRWHSVEWGEANETPMVYGRPVDEPMPEDTIKWVEGAQGYIHFKDGTVRSFWS